VNERTFERFTLPSCDGDELACYRLIPGTPPKAIVQIGHGMAEHASRYIRFARFLCDNNIAVYAHDHRGHGATTAGGMLGHFADKSGPYKILCDLAIVAEKTAMENPGVPRFLFGHSMGSFLARHYAAEHGTELSGLIISGTSGDPGIMGMFAKLIARIETIVHGKRAKSTLMNKLMFGSFNAYFKPNRTAFDWLSRDPVEVDAYCADPLCGFICTTQLYADLIALVKVVSRQALISCMPKSLPVFFVSGSNDPVGNNGVGVKKIFSRFEKAGMTDLKITLYNDARHELLNETNRDSVFSDILKWLEKHLPVQTKG